MVVWDKMFWGNRSRGIETREAYRMSRTLKAAFRWMAGEGERTWVREGRSCIPT